MVVPHRVEDAGLILYPDAVSLLVASVNWLRSWFNLDLLAIKNYDRDRTTYIADIERRLEALGNREPVVLAVQEQALVGTEVALQASELDETSASASEQLVEAATNLSISPITHVDIVPGLLTACVTLGIQVARHTN